MRLEMKREKKKKGERCARRGVQKPAPVGVEDLSESADAGVVHAAHRCDLLVQLREPRRRQAPELELLAREDLAVALPRRREPCM